MLYQSCISCISLLYQYAALTPCAGRRYSRNVLYLLYFLLYLLYFLLYLLYHLLYQLYFLLYQLYQLLYRCPHMGSGLCIS